MGDQFEKFIQENRAAFEEEPHRSEEERWKSIESQIEKRNYAPMIWKVAAVLFLISTSLLLVDRFYEVANEGPISTRHQEFRQAEAFYTSMIMEKRAVIESYSLEGLSDEFLLEVSRLDEMYGELKKTFDQSANDQQLMDAMIRNLQMRIEILNQQLKILETLKTVKNENVQNV